MVQNTIYISNAAVYHATYSPLLMVIREGRPHICSSSFSSSPIIHWFHYFSTLPLIIHLICALIELGQGEVLLLQIVRIEENFLNLIKGIYENSTSSVILSDERSCS